MTQIIGIISFMRAFNDTSPIAAVTNSSGPYGGVSIPIIMLIVNITPKNTGSIP